jgi:enoyl-CoA hydratase/carnithine racemase
MLKLKSGVTVITIDNPPLNTLTRAVRLKLSASLQRANNDPACKIILIVGKANAFSVGADIKELATPIPRDGERDAIAAYVDAYHTHNLAPLVYEIDNSSKPVVALINGPVLGGGLEIALGCQYRVCSEDSVFRFPEVLIGIIPGALGTQLLPRLTNYETCLSMCVGCMPMTAREALKAGLVDQIIPNLKVSSDENIHSNNYITNNDMKDPFYNDTNSLIQRMVAVLENQIARGELAPSPFRKTSTLPVKVSLKDAMALSYAYTISNPARVPLSHKGGLAARGAMEALLACVKAGTGGFEKGCLVESEISRTLVVSLEAQALRYVFLAEREAAQLHSKSKEQITYKHISPAAMPRIGGNHSANNRIATRDIDVNSKLEVQLAGVVGSGVCTYLHMCKCMDACNFMYKHISIYIYIHI